MRPVLHGPCAHPDVCRCRGPEACEAGQLGDGLIGERSDFRHFGHEPGHGAAIGHSFDRAEGLIEFPPQRISVDQRGDVLLEGIDLGGSDGEQFGERGFDGGGIGDQAALVQLRGAAFGKRWRRRVTRARRCCWLAGARQIGGDCLTSANQAMMPASMRSVFSSRPMLSAKWRTARGLRMATGRACGRRGRRRPGVHSLRWLPWPPGRPGGRGRRPPARRCLPELLGNEVRAPWRPTRASREDEAISTPQIMRVTVTCLVCATEFMRLFGRARLGQRSLD